MLADQVAHATTRLRRDLSTAFFTVALPVLLLALISLVFGEADEFLRLLYGARVSLEVALLSTLGVMVIGVILGSVAGYFRGWPDTIISRITEITMAYPLLLFIVALAATIGLPVSGFDGRCLDLDAGAASTCPN